MCGIIGIANGTPVAEELVRRLKHLEYRGYDSAGIALASNPIAVIRTSGRIEALRGLVRTQAVEATVGIGHTRWATHGAPSATNAHPHVYDGVAVVHNGIVENHAALRAELRAAGEPFLSDTDTEVLPHLIAAELRRGLPPSDAVGRALARTQGSVAIAVMIESDPGRIIAARRGSPLAVGRSAEGGYLSSDPLALVGLADDIAYLADGDVAEISAGAVRLTGDKVVQWQAAAADPVPLDVGSHAHFTAKEIAEQPAVIVRTLAEIRRGPAPEALARARRLTIVACGSSAYAGALARPWFEDLLGIPCSIEVASEFRYQARSAWSGEFVLFVSQSGETADTLAALEATKSRHVPAGALVNVRGSSIAREADMAWLTAAGPEIGVAATKSFTAQVVALKALAVKAATVAKRIDRATTHRLDALLDSAADAVAAALTLGPAMKSLARELAEARHLIFLGRGALLPVAFEAALKVKELTYAVAEAYPAGELKHGPMALIGPGTPVIAFAASGILLAKTLSNLAEVAARGARTVILCDRDGIAAAQASADLAIALPPAPPQLIGFQQVVAMQLLACHMAEIRGLDVDKPRNLAKSVTVE